MKVHPRYYKVREAALDLSKALNTILRAHGLTYHEAVEILLEQAQGMTKYGIRAERHPDDPDKKGDEE